MPPKSAKKVIPARAQAAATNRLQQHCIDHYEKRIPALSADVVRQVVVDQCADVQKTFSKTNHVPALLHHVTLMEYILRYGSEECLCALFSSPVPISCGIKAMEKLLAREDRTLTNTILDLFVTRLHAIPEALTQNLHLFSAASAKGCLSVFWSSLKSVVRSDAQPIPLSSKLSLEDFQQLSVEDRQRFVFAEGVQGCSTATAELQSLFACVYPSASETAAVVRCVQSGADVCACLSDSGDSILSVALRESSVACVAALLETPLPLPSSFSVETLCERHDVEEVKAVLQLVIARLQKYPHESTDFAKLFSNAGVCGVLSDVWSIVRDLAPKFGAPETLERIMLTKYSLPFVWAYDLEVLVGMEGNIHFKFKSGHTTYAGNRETAALARLSCSRFPDGTLVDKYVRSGGSVNALWAGRTILLRLIESGSASAVGAALQTEEVIDFSSDSSSAGNTVLHDLCCRKNADVAAVMLGLVVHRLQTHPIECYHLTLTNSFGLNFLSLAANNLRLSLFWSKVKVLNPSDGCPIIPIITTRVSLEDFKQLPAEDRCRFQYTEGVEACAAASDRLGFLFEGGASDPDAGAVAECVQAYADVCALIPGSTEYRILDVALRESSVACVAALLDTPLPLPLNISVKTLCERHDAEEVKAVLQLIMARLKKHPHENTDFKKLLQWAGECGLLSDVWSIVRDLPLCVEALQKQSASRFSLKSVWSYDWDRLGRMQEQQHFLLDRKASTHTGNASTAALTRLWRWTSTDASVVERYIGLGITVNTEWEGKSILSRLIQSGSVAAVRAALQTEEVIDFTTGSSGDKRSVLQDLYRMKNKDIAAATLDLVVQRLQTHPEDRIDFNLKDSAGLNFFSCAASDGCLALFWKKLRLVIPSGARLELSKVVTLPDFIQIPVEDRFRFRYLEGAVPSADATKQLQVLFNDSATPDVDAVSACVQAYSDVCAEFPLCDDSILSRALRECSVACVAALLNTPLPLPLNISVKNLCERHDVEEVKAVLQLIMARLKKHPHENVNFDDLLRRAGECGVLSDVWPSVRDLSDECRPKKSKAMTVFRYSLPFVWAYDLEVLVGMEGNIHFKFKSGHTTYAGNRETAALARLSCSRFPDGTLVDKYVRSGGSVNALWAGRTILLRLIESGSASAVGAALQTEEVIDFSSDSSSAGNTVLHDLCCRKNADVAAVMLGLVVHRLQTHPIECYHLTLTNSFGLNFLSLAANNLRLSLFWSKVKVLNPSDGCPIIPIITTRVSLEDFKQLPVEDRCRFQYTEGVEACAAASDRLGFLFEGGASDPDAGAVAECVQAYADVCALIPGSTEYRILDVALRESSVACVAALLDTPLPLPLSLSFFVLCERHDVEEVKAVLKVVVSRVQKRPHEKLDVENLLSRAGECGVLSDVWPILRNVPQFIEQRKEQFTRTYELSSVWTYDWDRLRVMRAPQKFKVKRFRGQFPGNAHTAALTRLSCNRSPDPLLVERYLRAGASVNMVWMGRSILSRLMQSGSVAAVAAALQTEEVIDFTAGSFLGKNTVLHDLCFVGEDSTAAAVLDLVVQRLQLHPEDRYDFSLKDSYGRDFLSLAGKNRRLALFWNKVKDFPYYADNIKGIRISSEVGLAQQIELGIDRELFVFER